MDTPGPLLPRSPFGAGPPSVERGLFVGGLIAAAAWRLRLSGRFAGWEESDYGNLAMIQGVLDGGFLHYDMNHMPGYYALGATSEETLGSEPAPPKMQRAISLPGSLPEPARLVPMPDRGGASAGSAPAPDPAPVYPPGRLRTTPGPVKSLMRAPNTPAGATLPPVIRAGGANLPPVPPPSTT